MQSPPYIILVQKERKYYSKNHVQSTKYALLIQNLTKFESSLPEQYLFLSVIKMM